WVALSLAGALLALAEPGWASTTCSEARLANRKANVIAAHGRWQASGSATDHDAYMTARTNLISYATRCLDALGGDLPKLLAGAVNIPFVDTSPPSGPGILEDIDLAVFHVPTSVTGPAGTQLTYDLIVVNYGPDNAVTP